MGIIPEKYVNNFLEHPFFLYVLSGFYPAIFSASNNWFMVAVPQLAFVLLVSPLVTLLLGLSLEYSVRIVNRDGVNGPMFAQGKIDLLRVFFAMLISVFLLKKTIFGNRDAVGLLFGGCGVLFFSVILFILVRKNGKRVLTSFLLLLSLISAVNWGAGSILKKIRNAAPQIPHVQSVNEKYSFSRKPNIYMVILESYASANAMKAFYGYDNSNMVSSLRRKGFSVYDNAYSNYLPTLASLLSVFEMAHHFYADSVGIDDSVSARKVLGGVSPNKALNVLKENGYSLQIIFNDSSLFFPGDILDYYYPPVPIKSGLSIYSSTHLNRLMSFLWREPDYDVTLYSVIRNRVSIAIASKKPWFTLIRPKAAKHGAGRIPYKEYIFDIKRTNLEVSGFIDYLLKADPSAVIILVGDHGSLAYRYMSDPAKVNDDLNLRIKREGLTHRDLALDHFGSLVAVKWQMRAPQIKTMSHVNLLRYVFISLTGNRSADATKVPDDAYFIYGGRVYKAVADGVQLSHWPKI